MNRAGSSSFLDTSSRGSQTEETFLGKDITLYSGGPADSSRKAVNACGLPPLEGPKKKVRKFSPVRSRLVSGKGPLEIPKSGIKPRKRTPWSNMAFNPPPQIPTPDEFSLNEFAFTALPDPHSYAEGFNDSLTIEHYTPSARSYMGKQRKGINEPFPNAASYEEHITEALRAPFPLFETARLPIDLTNALHFNRDNSVETIADFRKSQLIRLRVIAAECWDETEKWMSLAPEDVRIASGKIHVALLTHLARFTRMGGTDWFMQFVFGFPITGILSQKGVFPLEEGESPPLRDCESLFDTKIDRFQDRSSKNKSAHAKQLWDEAMTQVEKGWLKPPRTLNSSGNFCDSADEMVNIAFRFGVLQSDKLRGCDDLKDSLTNETCHIATPITLPNWDHIASSARILATNKRTWVFGKVDHRDAYKALPMKPSEARFATLALWDPIEKKWNGFTPRTLIFGSTAAVLHYNCLSRVIASLACRLLLLPTLGYFDDFGFIVAAEGADEAFSAFTEFFALFGIELKIEKSSMGNFNSFLGLDATFPAPDNRMTLSLSLSVDKAIRWAGLIERILRDNLITHTTLESLLGRLVFAQTAVFGKFARAMLKPLYIKFYAPRYNSRLTPAIIRNLTWWISALRNVQKGVIHFNRSSPDWILYTDAAFDEGPGGARMAAIFFRTSALRPLHPAELLLASKPSPAEVAYFQNTSTIFGLELAAVVLSIFHFRSRLRDNAVTVYIDNTAALAALINGDSSAAAAFPLIAVLWFLSASYNITLWFERVETHRNIADLPTRGVTLPFPVRDCAFFPRLEDAIAFYVRHITGLESPRELSVPDTPSHRFPDVKEE